jgi:hypothetical protein
LRTARGAIAEFRVTPPPRDLSHLLPPCAPADLWGAVSDILPFFMAQAQPKFRARELSRVGQRLRFPGYDTRWSIPPDLLDQRIVADSAIISLDSASTATAFVTWNTSPMWVTGVRRAAPGQRALVRGREWFVAQLQIDRANGELLRATTLADSRRLYLQLGYAADTVPTLATDSTGMLIRVDRRLNLRLSRE